MGRIFCLIGRSATGKSTLEKELVKLGYDRIVSNTTRPIRVNEIAGVDYNFITIEEFQRLKDNDELIESTQYNNWVYSISKDNIKQLNTIDLILVAEPHGFKELVIKLGKENVIPILITLSPYNRLNFAINREPNGNDETYKEICRRFQSDFDTFKEIESRNVFKVVNMNIQQSVKLIDTYIKSENYLYYGLPQDFTIGDIVKVIKIRDDEEAKHLIKFIGHEGEILSWINIKGEKRYKTMFFNDRNETCYFKWDELELVEGINIYES